MINNKAYITAAGKFLPGNPVSNDEMENYLGYISGKPSRTKAKMLERNGIISRYYAMDKAQKSLFSNSAMAAYAIDDCLKQAGINKQNIDFLGTATTQGDLPVPGFASMVHAAANLPACEIASLQGVCGSGMMAIQNCYLQTIAGNKTSSLAVASEFASRMFKSSRFEEQDYVKCNGNLEPETDFLRWMLSDGAGALLIEPTPSLVHDSLEIEWIDIRSYAHLHPACMVAGANILSPDYSWMDYSSFSAADQDGAINLKQNLKIVEEIVKLGVYRFFELINEGKIKSDSIDYLLCHYSSHFFKERILRLLKKGGLEIPQEKWFTNLYTKGNTGAASIFIMIEELLNSKTLKPGQEILCMVPESGRFLTTFMKLKVVGKQRATKTYHTVPNPPQISTSGNTVQEWIVRQLTNIWIDFENDLNNVSIVSKIHQGILKVEEYKKLIFNLRQQVVDGSQWIARAASNISMEYFDIRSSFLRHAADEHRDFLLLERNYLSLGGDLEVLNSGKKNIGSEALSAFMFQRASMPNPFDLLGGMFIIEGLGNRLAGKWGRAIQEQLNLQEEQVSFLIYHETSDANDNHFEKFENALNNELLTQTMAEKIATTAAVVAKLYSMQLQEIDKL